MPKRKDLTGKRFGRLLVESYAYSAKRVYWNCLCDCGNKAVVSADNLLSGKTKSCGCLMIEKAIENIRGQKKHIDDLTGQRFGRLIARTRIVKGRFSYWLCDCDCGNQITVIGTSLKTGNTRSCGCLAREIRTQTGRNSKGRPSKKLVDLTGRRFTRLLVIDRAENGRGGATRWNCICDCGKKTTTSSAHLLSGHTKSCGCLGLEKATKAKIKHGETGTRLYAIFQAMHDRCELPTTKAWRWYGSKGIKVCSEWSDYIPFRDWAVSHGYAEKLTIDRIDPNGNYEPANCRWITKSENSARVVHKKKAK